MQKPDRSWLAVQAYHFGRIVTGTVLGSGQQTVSGARGMARLAAECFTEFLAGVRDDLDIDPETRAEFVELAEDESFLLAVEDYVRRTRVAH